MKQVFDELLKRYPVLTPCRDQIFSAYEILAECFRTDNMLFTCGNGGSAADADHIVGELAKGFCSKRPLSQTDADFLRQDPETAFLADKLQYGFRAISLMRQTAIYTAAENDLDPSAGPAQQLVAMGRPGDVLLGLSTSGNARNLQLACRVAKLRKMKIIGMTGKGGGKLAQNADVCICVPESETFVIQELHLPIYHALCRMIERTFF